LAGLRVVKMLEAASRSLRNRGAAVYLDPPSASSINPPTLVENKQSPVIGVSHPSAAGAAASLG
jgi:hypothetical protein